MWCFRMWDLKIKDLNPSPTSALGVKSPHLQLLRVNKQLCSNPTSSNTTSLNSRLAPRIMHGGDVHGHRLRSSLTACRREIVLLLAACREEAKASFALPLTGVSRLAGAILSNGLAASHDYEHPCARHPGLLVGCMRSFLDPRKRYRGQAARVRCRFGLPIGPLKASAECHIGPQI